MEYERTMSEYLFLIAVVLLLAFLTERGYVGDWNSRGTRAARSIFIFVIFMAISFFIGLREFYNDTSTYRGHYEALQSFPGFWDHFDATLGENPGFQLVNGVLKTLNVSSQGFILIYALFTCGLYLIFIRRYSDHFLLSMFLLFTTGMYMFSAAAMKQTAAIAICLLAIPSALKKRWIPFLLLIGLAATFHPYALMYLAVPLLTFRPWSKWTYVLLILFVAAGFALDSILGTIVDIASMLGEEYSEEIFQDSGVNVFRVLVCSVPTFLTFVYRRELFRDSKPSENLMVNLCMINGAIMFVGLFGTANYFGRLANYFTIAQVVALPWILGKLSPHDRRVLTALMVICYTGYSLYGNLVNESFDSQFSRMTLKEYFTNYVCAGR